MNEDVRAADWEAVGIAQAGGVDVIGGGAYFFELASRTANHRAQFILTAAGFGFGGSVGGGVAPSPTQFVQKGTPNLFSQLNSNYGPCSSNDINHSYGTLSVLAWNTAYGYSLMRIQSGWSDPNFEGNVSGWGTGVGIIGAVLMGIWIRLGDGNSY